MKKYKVNVNGNLYEVELEVIDAADAAKSAPAASAAPVTTAPKAAPAPAASGSGKAVECPMPGTILSVNVKVGDSVKKGQLLVVLEAMKMENEILAPNDGRITGVNVTKGASVESGMTLCTIQ